MQLAHIIHNFGSAPKLHSGSKHCIIPFSNHEYTMNRANHTYGHVQPYLSMTLNNADWPQDSNCV